MLELLRRFNTEFMRHRNKKFEKTLKVPDISIKTNSVFRLYSYIKHYLSFEELKSINKRRINNIRTFGSSN